MKSVHYSKKDAPEFPICQWELAIDILMLDNCQKNKENGKPESRLNPKSDVGSQKSDIRYRKYERLVRLGWGEGNL